MNRAAGIIVTTCVVLLLIFLTTFFTVRAVRAANDDDQSPTVENASPTSAPSVPTPSPDVNQPSVDSSANADCAEPLDACSFVDDFSYINEGRWDLADNYSNGPPFANWWARSAISSHPITSQSSDDHGAGGKAALNVSIFEQPNLGLQYASGQMRSRSWFTYGCFEARIRPVNQSGYVFFLKNYFFPFALSFSMGKSDFNFFMCACVVDGLSFLTFAHMCRLVGAFFLYTGPHDAAPGQAEVHNEIDVEFVYRDQFNYLAVQTNFFVNGGRNELLHYPPDAPEAAQDSFHVYAFRWTSLGIQWFIDGRHIRTANAPHTPTLSVSGPLRLFVNLWAVSEESVSGQQWAGNYSYSGTRSMLFDWIRFTRGENCTIMDEHSTRSRSASARARASPARASSARASSARARTHVRASSAYARARR